jgi:signal recognition particle GTPase
VISGAAGTGKTATLWDLRRGLIEAGRQVVVLAPTSSAVAELQAVGFSGGITVERALQDAKTKQMAKRALRVPKKRPTVGARIIEGTGGGDRVDAR